MVNEKQMKTCSNCNVEKPVEEFSTYGKGGRYRQSQCKQCLRQKDRNRYTRRATENLKSFGTICTPEQLARERERYRVDKIRNVERYGTACTPTELRRRGELLATRKDRRRTQALSLLGNKCVCCGESRHGYLTFDHIDGGGTRSGVTSAGIVNEILAMAYPYAKYRILCWNCNLSIGFFGYCPHSGRPPEKGPVNWREKAEYNRQLRRGYKFEFVSNYGGRCSVCGECNWEFLTVDHVNGGGNQHRRGLHLGGAAFYRWLKRKGYPKNEFRLLCFNCNCGGEVLTRSALIGIAEDGKALSKVVENGKH